MPTDAIRSPLPIRTAPARPRAPIAGRRLPALLLAASCATAAIPFGCGTVPETGRSQFVLLSSNQEIRLGASAYSTELEGAKVVSTGAAA